MLISVVANYLIFHLFVCFIMNGKIETIEKSLKVIEELEKLVSGNSVGDPDSIGNKLYACLVLYIV